MKHQSDQFTSDESKEKQRKAYQKPAVVYEFELEVRAGSPLSPGPDLFDSLLDE